MYIFRARELDEKNAAELKATLSKGVLKNHRNDTYTRMQRSNTRTNNSYKKVRETREKKEALSIVDQELESLKSVQKANAARIKELNATKSDIASTRKSNSSKAESSSSGRVTGVSRKANAKAASKVATVKKGT